MAACVHSKEEARQLLGSISAEQWREGIVIFNPHRERQVRKFKNKRIIFRDWPEDLAERAINVFTHLKKRFGTDVGLEFACKRLERAHPEEKEQEET